MQNVNELTEKFTLDKIEIRQHAARTLRAGGMRTCAFGVMTFRMLEAPEVTLSFPVYAETDVHSSLCSPEALRYDVCLAYDAARELFFGVHENSVQDAEATRDYIDSTIRFEQFFEAELRAAEFIRLEVPSAVDMDPGVTLI